MSEARWATVLSVISLLTTIIFSAVTMYYQFFYKSHEIKLSVFGNNSVKNSAPDIDFIFNNSGNRSFTIISCNLLIKNRTSGKSFYSVNHSDSLKLPAVVDPNQQLIYRYSPEKVYYENGFTDKTRTLLNQHDTLSIIAETNFVNEKGNLSINYYPIGRVTYDSNKNIEYAITSTTYSLADSVLLGEYRTTVIQSIDTVYVYKNK